MALSDRRRRLLKRLHVRKQRVREASVLVEGARAVEEALAAGARCTWLGRSPRGEALWTPGLERAAEESGLSPEILDDDEMAEVAGTETPQGILAVMDEPRSDPAGPWSLPEPRILLLDGVQDPGNVGTLIRVAAAFGCSAVVALDGTADPWSPRAVRAAVGTGFRLPVLQEDWATVADRLAPGGVAAPPPLLVGDAGGTPVSRVAPGFRSWILAVGGEGAGCRPDLVSRSHAVVSIPMTGGVESLNVGVAGAILLYELSRDPR